MKSPPVHSIATCLENAQARRVADVVHINIPFTMLVDTYLPLFLRHRLHPEIGIDAQALEGYGPQVFHQVARRLKAAGLNISLHGPFADLSPGSSDPAVRRLTRHRLEQFLEVAMVFKPTWVVCHTGYDPRRHGSQQAQWLEHSRAIWIWVATALNDCGSLLMLENVYEESPQEMKRVLDTLKDHPNVGFCLDTGHQSAFSGTPLKVWLEEMGHRIDLLHLHDNNGSQDDHLGLGVGNVDFKRLFDYMKAREQRQPSITLEPHQEADLIPSLNYLGRHWPLG